MRSDRLVQLIALIITIVSTSVCGGLLPVMTKIAEQHTLRYTDIAVEGAPPFVVLGTAIGAVRGIIVDYLWIKVNLRKQAGLYFEVMADADLITKLQPRFAAVWAFQGHNMAYNISVIHNTSEERWEWVKAGINLVRNKGLRYNPNDLQLHRELAFWFSHKIEGVADDAHFYYKTELAREWHYLLGAPPAGPEARIRWIEQIANAPDSLQETEAQTPGVLPLVERLRSKLSPYEQQFKFALDSTLLRAYGRWLAVREHSAVAKILGREDQLRRTDPFFRTFDEIASDENAADAWNALLAHIRKRVLLDEYNMDPQFMLGMMDGTQVFPEHPVPLPIDWRHGSAHALYFALKGSAKGEQRVVSIEDAYHVVNNDRAKIQAMQDMARWGRISFDPFSSDLPGRFPEPGWVTVIDAYWEQLTIKHRDTRGPGPDLFRDFHQNFLSYYVRHYYRSGERGLARQYMERLNSLYGEAAPLGNPKYSLPLDVFVRNQTFEQYDQQPFLAPSEVAASLRYGFRFGLGRGREEVFEQARAFAQEIITFFTTTRYNDFVTKMGTGRLKDLISTLQNSEVTVLGQLMVDSTIPLIERLAIFSRIPAEYKVMVYDDIWPHIARQLQASDFKGVIPIDTALPPPPGIDEYRRQRALQEQQEQGEIPKARTERK